MKFGFYGHGFFNSSQCIFQQPYLTENKRYTTSPQKERLSEGLLYFFLKTDL